MIERLDCGILGFKPTFDKMMPFSRFILLFCFYERADKAEKGFMEARFSSNQIRTWNIRILSAKATTVLCRSPSCFTIFLKAQIMQISYFCYCCSTILRFPCHSFFYGNLIFDSLISCFKILGQTLASISIRAQRNNLKSGNFRS